MKQEHPLLIKQSQDSSISTLRQLKNALYLFHFLSIDSSVIGAYYISLTLANTVESSSFDTQHQRMQVTEMMKTTLKHKKEIGVEFHYSSRLSSLWGL